MFQTETEDMLPRVAPKPSLGTLNYNEALARPSVPEVSIVFGQQQLQQRQLDSCGGGGLCTQQSYAAWKKHMLPKVRFTQDACVTGDVDGGGVSTKTQQLQQQPTQRMSLYPLRSAAVISPVASTNNMLICATSTAATTSPSAPSMLPSPSNCRDMLLSKSRSDLLFQQHQRRSLEALAAQPPPSPSPPLPVSIMHNPLPTSGVLTICAGTQTDISGVIGQQEQQHGGCRIHPDAATKDDISDIFQLLDAMRAEQLRLREACEAMLVQRVNDTVSASAKVHLRDASTQSNEAGAQMNNVARRVVPPLMQQYIEEERSEQIEHEPTAAQMPSAQAAALYPVAQSTAYRQSPLRSANRPQQMASTAAALSKPATEKSMVMTELALKYLPNDKLTELMQDLQVSPAAASSAAATAATAMKASPLIDSPLPLRPIENLGKSPTEFSNASYKYLKKYRLLPEEAGHGFEQQKQQQQQQQQQQRSTSPILRAAQADVQSPIVHPGMPAAGTCLNHNDNMHLEKLLDLEAIRKQPKFL